MRFGSLFSGIGGFDLGFDRSGMECAWQVEIDAAARSVLARHWPDVQRYEDIRDVGRTNLAAVDVVCGGFPCQDVSIAGRRAGLAGARSGLWSEFHRILAELTPEWVVIENVPGLLSSDGGRDFATVLHGLVELRYGVCWRILDAQYFGVAQRRRRVFLVGHLGDGRAAEVLFERESVSGDSPESGETRAEPAHAIARGSVGSGYRYDANGEDFVVSRPLAHGQTMNHQDESQQTYVVSAPINAASPSRRNGGSSPTPDSFVVDAIDVRNSRSEGDISGTLQSKKDGGHSLNYQNPIAFEWNRAAGSPRTQLHRSGDYAQLRPSSIDAIAFTERTRQDGRRLEAQTELAYALTNPGSGGRTHSRQVAGSFGVRRLTPVECERLQGFPEGWTAEQSDSARYRQLGNAVCVPVAEWIAERIMRIGRSGARPRER